MSRKGAKAAQEQLSAWERFKTDPGSMEAICEHIVSGTSGESLRDFTTKHGFGYNTVLDWINTDPARTAHYTRAREDRADLVFDQLDDVSADAVKAESNVEVAGLRLKADNIKWKLARMSPKKYGEKLAVGGADDLPPIRQSLDLTRLSGAELTTMEALLGKAAPKSEN